MRRERERERERETKPGKRTHFPSMDWAAEPASQPKSGEASAQADQIVVRKAITEGEE